MKRKVLVWVRAGNEYLVLKTNAARESFWQPVTGSVEEGEALEAAALREFQEETGLEALRPPQAVSGPYEFDSHWGGRCREFPFLVEVDPATRGRVKIDPQEHQEFQWVSFERALELVLHESNKKVLRDIKGE